MASLFKRIQELFSANLNELLDRENNPQALPGRLIRELQDSVVSSRDGLIDALTSEKQLYRELAHQRRQASQWRERAALALQEDNETLARQALARKREFDTRAATLGEAHQRASQTTGQLRTQLQALEARLAEARQQQPQRPGEVRGGEYANELLGRLGARLSELSSPQEDPAAAADNDELAQVFRSIEQDAGVEQELAALKQALGKD